MNEIKVQGLAYQVSRTANNTVRISWYDPIYSLQNSKYNVFVDGSLTASTVSNSTLIAISPGEHQIEVIKIPLDGNLTNSDISYCVEYGKKIKINWTKCTDSQFKSYCIYIKKTSDSTWVKLVEISDVNVLSCYTPNLEENISYDVKIELKDNLGNETNNNSIYQKSINKLPNPIVLTATINAGHSGAMPNDSYVEISGVFPTQTEIAEYQIFSNFCPGTSSELLDGFNEEPLKVFYPGSTFFLQYPVFDGHWMFCAYSVDFEGLKSQSNIVELNINSDYSSGYKVPSTPLQVISSPIAAGIKVLTITDDPTNKTSIVYGIVDSSGAVIENEIQFLKNAQGFLFQSLGDSETFSTYSYYKNHDVSGNKKYGLNVKVDATGPSGSHVLTINVA